MKINFDNTQVFFYGIFIKNSSDQLQQCKKQKHVKYGNKKTITNGNSFLVYSLPINNCSPLKKYR